MRFNFLKKREIAKIPKKPGIYCFKNGGRKFLYIGKAINLRERVKNHFQRPTTPWERLTLLRQGFGGQEKIGYIKTDSEIEALILEANLIKKYQPKYNVIWRDDKNYFFVGVTKEDFPTVFITHQPKSKILNTKFIGPFVEGRALKQTLGVLRKIFPFRTCKPYSGKPCLFYQLGRCPGPCLLGSKSAKEIPGFEQKIKKDSKRNIKNLTKILEGKKSEVEENLKREMKKMSKIEDFEKAAKIRDQINSFKKVLSRSRILETIAIPENNWVKTAKEIKGILNKKESISRIEAYDISNIQGKEATGAMVTFINGRPDKNLYRKFKIKSIAKPNDLAMLREILERRIKHSEWGFPDLILIDGGIGQLKTALLVKNQNKNIKKIKMISLAKKHNELFIEGKKKPILLKNVPREIFNLILQLRDEAHRFAISYHKKLRAKALLEG